MRRLSGAVPRPAAASQAAFFKLAVAILLGLLLPITACERQRRSKVVTVEEEPAPLASVIHTGDPRSAIQLVKGFHEIEQNSWRWTRGEFAVTLRPPDGSATKGATLDLRLTVPDPVIQHLKSVTLSARIGSVVLEPQAFSTPGEYNYKRDIPASVLTGEAVSVDFSLDKFLAAGVADGRELGVVVTSIELISK
jgi:hypothetical protein